MQRLSTHQRKTGLLILLLIGILMPVFSQTAPLLRGFLDGNLYTIDPGTAEISDPIAAPAFASINSIKGLTYAPDRCLFFGIIDFTSLEPKLMLIDLTGEAAIMGPLRLDGDITFFAEGLAYDAVNGRLYAVGGLNGGVGANDNISNILAEVDPLTANCTEILQLGNIYPNPDADALAANDGIFFYFDGSPENSTDTAFTRFYALDFNLPDTLIQNPLIDSSGFLNVWDMTILNDSLFAVTHDELYFIDWPTSSYTFVGQTHDIGDFDNARMQGIATQRSGPIPDFTLGGPDTLCTDSTLVISIAGQVTADSIVWSDGSSGPEITITEPGDYFVTVFQNNCPMVSDTLTVISSDCDEVCEFAVPNVFTPNRDGMNDEFKVIFTCEREGEVDMKIYNRWGKVVYEAGDNTGWNGDVDSEPAPSDVYYYVINVRVENDGIITEEVKRGDLTLVR